MKTIGWIGLGLSPAGGMKGADIAVGWVDSSGKAHIQDRFAFDKMKPVIDNTTQDWFLLQGQEQNGWTAIQFKRYFDSCDTMDVPIKSGTNILIFAYGLVDLDLSRSEDDIMYHESRRSARMLPLRSYSNQPADDMFVGLDFFDFSFENYVVPPTDTTYHCKVFKSPSTFLAKRHAIAHKILIDSRNVNLLHHLDLFECPSTDVYDDAKLPDGICDDILNGTRKCSLTIATAWAIGADVTTLYPEEAGYAVTSDIGTKYFMIKIHYDNPRLASNLQDSSGIRFYLGNKLRQYDLSYLIFGTLSNPASLAIPPKVEQFIVDSYCPPEATRGGQRTIDEMCSHTFSYYPLVDSLAGCMTAIDETAWRTIMNTSSPIDNSKLAQWLHNLTWTTESTAQWQEFFDKAQRRIVYGREGQMESKILPTIPKYEDLKVELCNKKEIPISTDQSWH
ncbi:unnamed protein product [Rotaria sordida]|uniref:DOMON domain-containing protein n=1 Tax=Rotaria sordida TaxID=392033 RepID=A0A819PMZ0_9BILA|nr:unnamed protein product [Rotaria sordida]